MDIALSHASYRYEDGTNALQDICLHIGPGERIALLGENGAGKSTLFHLLTGLIRPTTGVVLLDGKPAKYHGARLREWRTAVGYVFQDPDIQLVAVTVTQEVSYGVMNLGVSPGAARCRTEQALAFTGISELADKPVHFLSQGQKKLVSIADILVMEPQVVLLDEPTAWLDPEHTQRVMELLNELHAQGCTVVLSTHDVELAYRWADRAILLSHGMKKHDGSVREAFLKEGLVAEAGLRQPFLMRLEKALTNSGCSIPPEGLSVDISPLVPELRQLFMREEEGKR